MSTNTRNILIAFGASVLEFIVAMVMLSLEEPTGKDFGGVIVGICIAIAVVTYLICGGLKMALSAVIKAFSIGMIIPFFPANFIIALALVFLIGGCAVFLPVVIVLINMLANKNKDAVVAEADATMTEVVSNDSSAE